MNFTDKDVPICCGECSPDTYCEGLEAMIEHILKLHKNYTPEEAVHYAESWLKSAYESIAEQEAQYASEMRGRKHVA